MPEAPALPAPPASTPAPEAPAQPAAPPRPAPRPGTPGTLPPFRVLLHNDDEHDMLFVVTAITELTPLTIRQATTVMLTAHSRGVALVLVTHKERAELYQDQFTSKGLTVTIEPAEA